MNTLEISLWLEDVKYRALERRLKENGLDVTSTMQEKVYDLYEEYVPEDERQQIERIIREERIAEKEAEEAAKKWSLLKVTEHGCTTFLRANQSWNWLLIAQRVRLYEKGCTDDSSFINFSSLSPPLSHCEYERLLSAFAADDNRILSVFDVDFDNKYFSVLDRKKGWKQYQLKDICTAASYAFRKSYRPQREREEIFLTRLEGKEINCRNFTSSSSDPQKEACPMDMAL